MTWKIKIKGDKYIAEAVLSVTQRPLKCCALEPTNSTARPSFACGNCENSKATVKISDKVRLNLEKFVGRVENNSEIKKRR
jgi:hypothetical protein